jgi:hypothetical protein
MYWQRHSKTAQKPTGTNLFSQLDKLGELVMYLGAKHGILLGKVLHELGVARRYLGAQLRIPVKKTSRSLPFSDNGTQKKNIGI